MNLWLKYSLGSWILKYEELGIWLFICTTNMWFYKDMHPQLQN